MKNDTDLQHRTRAADQEIVTGEHEPFSRWAALIEAEKAKQRERGKVKAEKHRGRER